MEISFGQIHDICRQMVRYQPITLSSLKRDTVKKILFVALMLAIVNCNKKKTSDKVVASDSISAEKPVPYKLKKLPGWAEESFPLPPSFSQQITVTGVEEIRFAPQWANPASDNYWSYCFLWWINGKVEFDQAKLELSLTDYYNGLYKVNSPQSAKSASSEVVLAETENVKGDVKSFVGTITTMDYQSQMTLKLNCKVRMKKCDNIDYTAILFLLSPKAPTHAIWTALDDVGNDFVCSN